LIVLIVYVVYMQPLQTKGTVLAMFLTIMRPTPRSFALTTYGIQGIVE
jgi:hypothetical protein